MERPALRIAIALVAAEIASATLPIPDVAYAVVLAVALGLALRYDSPLLTVVLSAAVGCVLGSTARMIVPDPAVSALGAAPCRVDATVTAVLHADSQLVRVAVRGTVDRKDLPAVAHAALVTVWRPDTVDQRLCIGQRIVLTGTCAGPPSGTLQTDVLQRASMLAHNAWWTVRTDGGRVDVVSDPSLAGKWFTASHSWINSRLQSTLPADVWPVAVALLTGNQAAIDRSQRLLMAQTGTAHMLSVSGSHVALVASIIVMLTTWLPPGPRMVMVLGSMALFVMLAGAEPPAIRALVAMAGIVVGMAYERDIDSWNIFGAAVAVMVCFDPVLPWRTGFQLSAAGVAGILLFSTPLRDLLERVSTTLWAPARAMRSLLSVSMAASAGVAIPSAITFGSVALVSPIANLLVVPLLSMAMLAAVATVVLPFGWLYAPFVTLGVEWSMWVASALSHLHIDTAWPVTSAVVSVASTAWMCRSRHPRDLGWRMASGTAITVLILCLPGSAPPDVEVHRRPSVVAIIMRRAAIPIMVIRDRKGAGQRPVADRALARHAMRDGRMLVLEDGLCAGATVDVIEDSIPVLRRPLPARGTRR